VTIFFREKDFKRKFFVYGGHPQCLEILGATAADLCEAYTARSLTSRILPALGLRPPFRPFGTQRVRVQTHQTTRVSRKQS